MPPVRRSQTHGVPYTTRSTLKSNSNSPAPTSLPITQEGGGPGRARRSMTASETSKFTIDNGERPESQGKTWIGKSKRRFQTEVLKVEVQPERRSTRLVMQESQALSQKPLPKQFQTQQVTPNSGIPSGRIRSTRYPHPKDPKTTELLDSARKRSRALKHLDAKESSDSSLTAVSDSSSSSSSTSPESSLDNYVPTTRARNLGTTSTAKAPRFSDVKNVNVKSDTITTREESDMIAMANETEIIVDENGRITVIKDNQEVNLIEDQKSQNSSSSSFPSLPSLTLSNIAQLDKVEGREGELRVRVDGSRKLATHKFDWTDNGSDLTSSSDTDEVSVRSEFGDCDSLSQEDPSPAVECEDQEDWDRKPIAPEQDAEPYDDRDLAGSPEPYVQVIEEESEVKVIIWGLPSSIDRAKCILLVEEDGRLVRKTIENQEKQIEAGPGVTDQEILTIQEEIQEEKDIIKPDLIQKILPEEIVPDIVTINDSSEDIGNKVVIEFEGYQNQAVPQTQSQTGLLLSPDSSSSAEAPNIIYNLIEPPKSQNPSLKKIGTEASLSDRDPSVPLPKIALISITSPNGITFPIPSTDAPEPPHTNTQPDPLVGSPVSRYRDQEIGSSSPLQTPQNIEFPNSQRAPGLDLLATIASNDPGIQSEEFEKNKRSFQWWKNILNTDQLDPTTKKLDTLAMAAANIDDLPEFGFDRNGSARDSLPSVLRITRSSNSATCDEVSVPVTEQSSSVKQAQQPKPERETSIRFSPFSKVAVLPQEKSHPIHQFQYSAVRDEPRPKVKIVSKAKKGRKDKF